METFSDSERDPAGLQSGFSLPLLSWYRNHRRDLPWRRTKDPYAILVSEMMLQQTQVKTVIPYYERWMKKYPTVHALAEASETAVLKSWEGLGYYRRARYLHAAARQVVAEYNGIFPKTLHELQQLPGVGRYTLGALGSIAFDLRLPLVDGNVIRVLSRWFRIREPACRPEIRKRLWILAEDLIPSGSAGDFNQAMMELGATVCMARKPSCLLCPVRWGCRAFEFGETESLPVPSPRPATVRLYEYAGLIVRGGLVMLCQRKQGQRMGQLWQFPSVLLRDPNLPWKKSWKQRFGSFGTCENVATIDYGVTHHHVRLELHRMENFSRRKSGLSEWIPIATSRELAFTAAHRKLAEKFLWASLSSKKP